MKVPAPRKLSSGTWFIQLRLGGVSTPVTAETKTECIHRAQIIKAEYRAGVRKLRNKAEEPTLHDAIDAYIERRKNTLSPSTIVGYRRIQTGRFKDHMQKPLGELTDWQTICDAEAKLCSPKTLRNAWGFVTSVLRDSGYPVPSVTLPTAIPHERAWLEPEQIKTLVASVRGQPEELPVLLALHSLRRSELLALEWKDVDLEAKTFRVRGALVKDETGRFVRRAANKNSSSARTLPIMIPELLTALEAVPEDDRNGPVVKINGNSILRHVNQACSRAGLPEVGTHGLRHSFASLAYHLGLSELETMELGGWSDEKTMRKIYTHLAASDRLKAQNKMAEFYQNAK